MYNSYLYNSGLYNGLGRNIGQNDQDTIVFNSYGLQNTMIVTTNMIDSIPERSLDIVDRPRAHGQILLNDWWRTKDITLTGYIRATSVTELAAEVDQFKYKMSDREGNLDIKIDGVVRRYVATLANKDIFDDRKGYHVTFMPWKLVFRCLTPFAVLPNYISDDFLNETDLSLNEQIENEGTTVAQPVLIFNFSAANAVTALSWTNNTNNEAISITTSISAGDYIRIDGETKQVTKNGTVIDYSGIFPLLDVGINSFSLNITGTSATYSHTVKYLQPYL